MKAGRRTVFGASRKINSRISHRMKENHRNRRRRVTSVELGPQANQDSKGQGVRGRMMPMAETIRGWRGFSSPADRARSETKTCYTKKIIEKPEKKQTVQRSETKQGSQSARLEDGLRDPTWEGNQSK